MVSSLKTPLSSIQQVVTAKGRLPGPWLNSPAAWREPACTGMPCGPAVAETSPCRVWPWRWQKSLLARPYLASNSSGVACRRCMPSRWLTKDPGLACRLAPRNTFCISTPVGSRFWVWMSGSGGILISWEVRERRSGCSTGPADAGDGWSHPG
jgi:hypothetical protein